MPGDGCIGEIRMFGGNFAPRNWALCNGQLLSIADNTALFSILGTTYGGDGRTTFGLPDLRGRIPMHPGNGPGLTPRQLGQKGGVERVQLTNSELPSHAHPATSNATMKAISTEGDSTTPKDRVLAKSGAGDPDFGTESNADTSLHSSAISVNTNVGNAGGNESHQNLQPYNCVNFIICLFGIFPSRP
tara:strand:+ start:4657 stop:5220 length:564 start_codon:yes stop_codon:yes gene_type:complete